MQTLTIHIYDGRLELVFESTGKKTEKLHPLTMPDLAEYAANGWNIKLNNHKTK